MFKLSQMQKYCQARVITRFSRKPIKGDYVWIDEEKTEVMFVANENGRFIAGFDPYIKVKWWQKALSFFKLYKTSESYITIFKKNANGDYEFLK
jgi:hypothetical protein